MFYWNRAPKGGHFAAFEQPKTFVEELRAAFTMPAHRLTGSVAEKKGGVPQGTPIFLRREGKKWPGVCRADQECPTSAPSVGGWRTERCRMQVWRANVRAWDSR